MATDTYLAEIWIYPVKSMAGIRVKDAWVQESGLNYDRRWMLVDDAGNFITQRTLPQMSLIDVSITPSVLSLCWRKESFDPVQVVVNQATVRNTVQVRIWNDVVVGYTVEDVVNKQLSRWLGQSVRLVEMMDNKSRMVNSSYSKQESGLSFADEFPFLLTSTSSLEDLNAKLQTPVDMRRFRPNLVVSGCVAFAEDAWNYIQIGSVKFAVCKPCERCMVINVDPDEGIRQREPLKTLASYRKRDRKILFGQDLMALDLGKVREGDKVTVW